MTTSSWEKRGTYGYKLGSTPMTKLQLKLLESLIYTRESETEKEMEVVQVLHMNGGIDETSYASNSLIQVNLITNPLPPVFSKYIQVGYILFHFPIDWLLKRTKWAILCATLCSNFFLTKHCVLINMQNKTKLCCPGLIDLCMQRGGKIKTVWI